MSGGCVFQIDSYERLYEEVSKCENTKVFSGWLQCDCRPFKQALLNTIKRWSFMFKRHLSNHVLSRWAPLPTLSRRGPHPGRAPEIARATCQWPPRKCVVSVAHLLQGGMGMGGVRLRGQQPHRGGTEQKGSAGYEGMPRSPSMAPHSALTASGPQMLREPGVAESLAGRPAT